MNSDKLNILFVVHSFNTRAGTEEHVKTLIKGLASDFNIFVAYPEDGKLILRLPNGEEAAAPGCPSSWPVVPDSSEDFDKSFAKILELSKPDLIHIHHLNYWPLSTIKQISELNTKKIMTFHDYFALTPLVSGGPSEDLLVKPEEMLTAQYATQTFGSDISDFLVERKKILEALIESLSSAIVPSQFASEIMVAAFPAYFEIIEHGIEQFEVLPKIAASPLRFGFIGSLIPEKGWTLLAQAFYKLREKFGDIELHLYGGDASRDVQIPGLFFHGVYDRSSLPEILSKFHVGVIPSNFAETYCLTLSELWMAKIPVIAAKIGSLKERVLDGANGVFFKPADVQDLITKMEWFCTNDGWKNWQMPTPRLVQPMLDDYKQLYSS